MFCHLVLLYCVGKVIATVSLVLYCRSCQATWREASSSGCWYGCRFVVSISWVYVWSFWSKTCIKREAFSGGCCFSYGCWCYALLFFYIQFLNLLRRLYFEGYVCFCFVWWINLDWMFFLLDNFLVSDEMLNAFMFVWRSCLIFLPFFTHLQSNQQEGNDFMQNYLSF